MEGKALYVYIEKQQEEMDEKLNAAIVEIREEWVKAMAVELKEQMDNQFIILGEQLEKDMDVNSEKEWDRKKGKISEDTK